MPCPLAVFADRLGDGQDVRLIERAAQRRATVTAGAEADPLCAIRDVGLARVVLVSKVADIDEKVLWSGLAGERMDRHGIAAVSGRPSESA